jgi:molybdopterin-guanine dinucleotide biosynthesis protein A
VAVGLGERPTQHRGGAALIVVAPPLSAVPGVDRVQWGSFSSPGGARDQYSGRVRFDALILAGGRSTRLGGEPKAALVYRGQSLLQISLCAAARARTIVVVGDDSQGIGPDAGGTVRFVREKPTFGGPAAAIAAGITHLRGEGTDRSEFTLVIACDMPEVAGAVGVLVAAASTLGAGLDGVLARDGGGREQYLVAIFRTAAIEAAVNAHRSSGGVDGLSVRSLVGGLALAQTDVPAGSTEDIDTWADAAQRGVTRP